MMSLKWVYAAVLILSLILNQIKYVLPDSFKILSAIPFWIAFFLLFMSGAVSLKRYYSFSFFAERMLLLFWLITISSVCVSYLSGWVELPNFLFRLQFFLMVFLFGFSLFYAVNNPTISLKRFSFLLYSPLIYILISVTFYFFGINRDWSDLFEVDYESGQALMLQSLLGLQMNRVYFYFSNGVNSFSLSAGLSLLLSVYLLFFSKKYVLGSFFIFISLVAVLLVDSRSSVLYCSLALFLAWFSMVIRYRVVPYLVVVLIFSTPLLLQFFGSLIGGALFELGLVRSADDLVTFNARSEIWNIVFAHFANFEWHHLIGYGNFGQQASGITTVIASSPLFFNFASPELLSMHNTYLQILVDMGWIGVATFIMFLFSMVYCLIELKTVLSFKQCFLLFTIFFYCLFFSNTELSVLSSSQIFIFFWCYVFFVLGLYKHKKSLEYDLR